MKKLFIYLLAVTTLAGFSAQAQESKTTLGIFGGANYNEFMGTDYYGYNIENEFKEGFHLGLNLEIPISPVLYFQPGMQFITKGTQHTDPGYFTVTLTTYYVEMPVKIILKPRAGTGKFLFGIGPDISYGLGGTFKYDEEGGTQNDRERKMKFKNTVTTNSGTPDNSFLKPLDVAVGVLIGYQLKSNLFFQIHGQMSILNMASKFEPVDPDNHFNMKNIGLGLSVGYRFGN